MRAIPWALIPWAPQHVRVLPRTNTPSRTARLSPWAFTRWAPQHVSVLSRTNTLSRTALFRPGLSPVGRHSTSACFRAQIRYRVLRSFALGSHPLGATARPRAFAYKYAFAYCAQSPWALIPWAPQHVRVLPRTNTLSRTARLSPWALIPWAPQHVRVLSRTNTLSRTALFALGSHPWAPQHVRVFSRTNTLSRIARCSPLGSNPSGPTARPRAFAH
jgi:hypothetical protein